MSNKDKSLALLPNGFVDLLPPYAQREAHSIRILMDEFASFGYRRIKPPLFEFEDSLLAPGPGARLAPETFRLMDPVSHRMMGVRSDITPQIARIVSTRLGNEPRPLRLAYANDVLRTRGSQMRTERQFTQVGCELIGEANNIETDIELCVLAILGGKALDLCDITLDFTVPGFVGAVLAGVDEDYKAEILKAVSRRDSDALKDFGLAQTDILAQAIDGAGCASDALAALDGMACSPALTDNLKRLGAVCTGMRAALDDLGIDDVNLTVDVIDQDGFEYHKGLGFTLFSSAVHGEIGRGGAYDVRFGHDEQSETAKGFTLYMDTISKCVGASDDAPCLYVEADVSWKKIRDLQAQGWIIIRGIGNDTMPRECTHMLKDGTVTTIS